MKLKSWMEAHIVRARRKKKEPKTKDKEKDKDKKNGKSDSSSSATVAAATAGSSTATPAKVSSSAAVSSKTETTRSRDSTHCSASPSPLTQNGRKVVSNPSTTFLRCGETAPPATPPYLSVHSSNYDSVHAACLDNHRQLLVSSTTYASPYHGTARQQQQGLCQCFGSLGLDDHNHQRGGDSLHSQIGNRESPTPALSVPYLSQYHLDHLHDGGSGSGGGSVNLNSPRQRSKIRTNPWLLTPKISRDSSHSAGRPLLASISTTSSESCTESHRDSFVSSGTDGCGEPSPVDRCFPPNPFATPQLKRHTMAVDNNMLAVRGKPLHELVSCTLNSTRQPLQQHPPSRQCLFPPISSTPKKNRNTAAIVPIASTTVESGTPYLLRAEPPLRKRSVRSNRHKGEVGRLHSVCTEDDDDESDECDTLNEMGNFSEHYNAYFDRETDILADDDDPYRGCGGGQTRGSSSTLTGRATFLSAARGGYYRPPPYALPAEQAPRPSRDLLRGNDDDYSEKLEFADVDEAYSEMSGSLEEEEEEEEVEMLEDRYGDSGDGDGGCVVGQLPESEPIRIRIRHEGSDKTLHQYEDDEEEAHTPDSAFPSSESELSSLMAAGSCCSSGSTPLAETASSSGASDSGRSTIHDGSCRLHPDEELTEQLRLGGVTMDECWQQQRGGLTGCGGGGGTSSFRCRHLVAAQSVRESLEDKVRWLQMERLVVQEKIREAREEERARHMDRERFRHQLALHRRQVLLRTLHELRLKMDAQSMRLQEAYQVTLHTHHLLARRRQKDLPSVMASAASPVESAALKRRSWEVVGRLM